MRMSTKGRFAVNAMIDLALRERRGPVALSAIAARQQVSLSYLEQLFSRLRRDGLVVSTRGPGGGYTLGRTADAISVADIVTAVEDDSEETATAGATPAPRGLEMARSLWDSLSQVMHRHLSTVSLRSLVDEQVARGASVDEPVLRRAISAQPVVRPVRTNAPNSVFAFGQSFAR